MSGTAGLSGLARRLRAAPPLVRVGGVVVGVGPAGSRVAGLGPFVALGDRVAFGDNVAFGEGESPGEVVGIARDHVDVRPFEVADARLGGRVWHIGRPTVAPDASWRGRVIDALLRPLDGGEPLAQGVTAYDLDGAVPKAMTRARVGRVLRTGVRAVDLFTPLCAGQRIGIFAGSGVGKSTLLAMLANGEAFDSVVVGLVGERGREVRDFVDDTLGAARSRATVVVATGDEAAGMRALAPRVALCIAEARRDAGDAVLLLIDSVTRYAHALREGALAAGEPPVARGYPPSVFAALPRLLERAGPGEGRGSITAIVSVLVDGDDHDDPVADTVRGTLDGHIVLARAIADQGRFPAIDLGASISRLARAAWSGPERQLIATLKDLVARYEETRDLRLMGAYRKGDDAALDRAVALVPRLYASLEQAPDAPAGGDPFSDLAALLRNT